jgi:hypothetical protein
MDKSRVESIKEVISSLLAKKDEFKSADSPVVSLSDYRELMLKVEDAHVELFQALKDERNST